MSRRCVKLRYLVYTTAILCLLCGVAQAQEQTISSELQRVLASITLFSSEQPVYLKSLQHFYQRRDYRPAWCDTSGVSPAAGRWISVLEQIEREGIEAAGPERAEIETRLTATDASQMAELELLLSASFLRYARSLGQGRLEASLVDPEWHIPQPAVDTVALLEQAVDSGRFQQVIDQLLPSYQAYRQLREVLSLYVFLERLGGWPLLPERGPKLQVGSDSPEIQTLREQLWMLGDLEEHAIEGTHYDEALEEGIRSFQKRHGLIQDGIVGRRTRAALAVPVEQRIQQIRLNLERWRWLPRDLGERYIVVNTAAFELHVHEGTRVPLSMRVIVGKKKRETPVFTEKLQYLIVNPYWHVPTKLALRDLIPAQLRDPNYFMRKRIRVLSSWQADAVELRPEVIDWESFLDGRYLTYKLRQDPGAQNSLGRIKFMLPNPYSVYLHDTPARHLFDKPVRTFSSGCVRVEDAYALANYVMTDRNKPYPQVHIEDIIEQGETRALTLPAPLPVYMLYQTAWVDNDGRVQFRDDVYRRDRGLALALLERSEPNQTKHAKNLSLLHLFSQLR